jgi:uncharacterized protein involved in exopolysaccharide biosynthesis
MNGLPYTGSFDDRGVIDTLIVVKKRKLLSFTAFAGVSFFSLGVLTAVTPKYDASAILMVGNEKGDHNVDTQHKNALNSLALIADSQEVVSGAITAFGLPRLIGREKGEEQSAALSWPTVRAEAIAWLTDHAGRLTGQANAETSVTEPLGANERSASAGATVADHQLKRAVSRVSKALTVHVEPNSDLVTITFRDADAEVAAEFANAIAMEAINKRLSVLDQSEAANFYQAQTRRFEDEVKRATDDLRRFSTTTHTYSADEQNSLLLKRANDLAAALAATHGVIADKTGRREALTAQLVRLKPVTQSSFVSSIINDLGATKKSAATIQENLPKSSEPPILMVKVYQEALVELLKVNAELEGLTKLEHDQRDQLAQLNQELNELAGKAGEFARLQRAVAQATESAGSYARRTVEEKIASSLNVAKISPVKIIQRAVTPVDPAFPRYGLMLAGVFALSLAASIGAPLYAENRSRKRRSRSPTETTYVAADRAPRPAAASQRQNAPDQARRNLTAPT